jgi:hypothetical protein
VKVPEKIVPVQSAGSGLQTAIFRQYSDRNPMPEDMLPAELKQFQSAENPDYFGFTFVSFVKPFVPFVFNSSVLNTKDTKVRHKGHKGFHRGYLMLLHEQL